MSFDWENYLVFAEKLVAIVEGKINCPELDNQETTLRNALSRTYYAAYHKASDYLLANTIFIKPKFGSHDEVIRAYNNSQFRERKAIAPKLYDLKEFRIKADYQPLYKDSAKHPRELLTISKLAIQECRKVLSMIDNFKPHQGGYI